MKVRGLGHAAPAMWRARVWLCPAGGAHRPLFTEVISFWPCQTGLTRCPRQPKGVRSAAVPRGLRGPPGFEDSDLLPPLPGLGPLKRRSALELGQVQGS